MQAVDYTHDGMSEKNTEYVGVENTEGQTSLSRLKSHAIVIFTISRFFII